MKSTRGIFVTDLDDNDWIDLTGSYGVNIFGNDFYKECITEAEKRAHALGPVLGPYHPVITDNVRRYAMGEPTGSFDSSRSPTWARTR